MFSTLVSPTNRTCNICGHVFSADTLRGLFENHTLRCGGFRRRSMGDKEPPVVPIALLEAYHGHCDDRYDDNDREYEAGGDLKRTRHLLDDAPLGMQETNFHDVCLEMDRDPEAPVPTEVVVGGETSFQRFQQSLEARATCANPLGLPRVAS